MTRNNLIHCINASTACPRPCVEDCERFADKHEDEAADRAREEAAEQHDEFEYEEPMHEDAACGRPCGGEPLMCANCPELTGEREYEPDDYLAEEDHIDADDGEGCDYCDWYDKCRYCPNGKNVDYTACPQGPPMMHRPGFRYIVNLLVNKGLAVGPGMAETYLCREQDYACDDCRIGCEGCDYQWQRERLDKGEEL